MRRERRMTGGFTLVELMISMAILIVIVVWLMGAFTTQHQTYIVVDEVSQAQGNARAVADLIESDLQKAGYKVPEQAAVCGLDQTAGPDTLYVSATDQLLPVGPALALSLLVPNWTARITATAAGSITLNTFDIDNDGTNDFVNGGGVIIFNEDDPNGLVACAQITGPPAGGILPINVEAGVVPAFGSRRAVPAHRYDVNANQLRRDTVILIDDVEDFQVAYFIDTNRNNLVDAGETHGDGQGATPTYNPNVANGLDVREVRLNLIVRTANPDPRQQFTEGTGQVTENRTAASLPGPDAFRRRIHTASVRVRNVGTR